MTGLNKDTAIRLQAIIDTAIDGIITIDARGIIESVNNSAADLFQYSKDELIGNNISMMMPSPDRENHDSYIERYQKTRKPRIVGIGREVTGMKKDGTLFPFRLAVSEVQLEQKVIYTGIVHDLTDIKEAQQRIENLNRELEQKVTRRTYELEKVVNELLSINNTLESEVNVRKTTEKKLKENEIKLLGALKKEKELNELKSRFVSMASHEFRTPLASILSSAAIIGKYQMEEQQDKREKHISRIKNAVSNLTNILDDFLSLNKIEAHKVTVEAVSFDLVPLIHEVSEDANNLYKSSRVINTTVSGIPYPIVSDKSILRNVVFNLISNALKYSKTPIDIQLSYYDSEVKIEIKDYGIGIPTQDQKHIFSRFFRASNVTNIQGTGLGLNIVKGLVNLLEGEISFKSTANEETTFIIIIPKSLKI